MKLVHTADWHIGRSLNEYSLLEDQRYWFSKFTERMKEIRPDSLVIAGDLYDRSVPSAEAVSLCDEILEELVLRQKIKTFIIAGNHDSKERLSFASGLLKNSGLYMAGMVSKEIRRISLSGQETPVNFYLLPYFEPYNVKMLYPDAALRSQEEALRLLCGNMLDSLRTDEINILAAHGLYSCKKETGDWDVDIGGSELSDASLFEAFDYVALGHLHSRRRAGSGHMFYSGSPLKYSVDEARQKKCFLVAEIEKGEISVSEETISPLHDVRIAEDTFSGLLERGREGKNEDYIFAELTDRVPVLNAMLRLKAVFPNIIGLRYKNLLASHTVSPGSGKNMVQKKTELELFCEFYHTVTDGELTCNEQRYIEDTLDTVRGEKK